MKPCQISPIRTDTWGTTPKTRMKGKIMTNNIIGIDVSQAKLDVYSLNENIFNQFPNDNKGLKKLCLYLLSLSPKLVVYEPTGNYHLKMEKSLLNQGFSVARINPIQLRNFARANGIKGKTDKLDAKIIAQYGHIFHDNLRPSHQQDDDFLQAKELYRIVQRFVTDRKNQLLICSPMQYADNKKSVQRIIAVYDREIAKAEGKLLEFINSVPFLLNKFKIITSMKGVGKKAAFALIFEMPEIDGELTAKQIASLVGLAPFNKDSGKFKGKRSISGGRKIVRCALYMPARSAVNHNPVFREKFLKLTKNGKHDKVAITAIMRKMLIVLNAMLKKNQHFVEKSS